MSDDPTLAQWLIGGGGIAAVLAWIGKGVHWLFSGRNVDSATARLSEEQANDLLFGRLYRHIEAQNTRIEALETDFAAFREASGEREDALTADNKKLRQDLTKANGRIRQLERQIKALLDLFKIHPVPPEIMAMVEQLDQINGE